VWGFLVIIRLRGQFGAFEQSALRAGFDWVSSSASIDLQNATLGAGALGEIMALAKRVGSENVTLVKPTPLTRRVLSLTQLDRVLSVYAA
jgi:anti-anti-sigma regulatory factor